MKIAFVDLLFNWPPEGGARVDVKEVGERLARNHDVRLFVPQCDYLFPRGQLLGKVPFPVEPLPFDALDLNLWTLPNRFAKALRQFAPDVVYILDAWHFKPRLFHGLSEFRRVVRFYAYESLCLRGHGVFFRRGHPCYRDYLSGRIGDHAMCLYCALSGNRHSPVFMHEFLAAGAFTRGYRLATRNMLSGAHAVVCYNDLIASRIRPYNNHVHVVPSGVDPSRFSGCRRESGEKAVISMIGRTGDPLKGLSTLLMASELLWQRRKDFVLRVTLERTQEAEFGREFVQPERWREPEEIPALYDEVDICVVPSLWDEPFGIVALEAMAAARPVVVTRVGGLQNIVRDGVTGYVIDRRDDLTMADRLETLIANPELRWQMGCAGREEVFAKYRWDDIVERYYEPLFREVSSR